MKFRMAPNSLFAILLRQPWWVSLLIAVLFAAVCFALLPAEAAPFGAVGALPFLGLSAIALKRQWGRPSARRVEAVATALSRMGWEEFRRLLEQAFTRDGWQVERLSGAADLRLRKAGQQVLVGARRWKAARHGEEALVALRGAMVSFDTGSAMYLALGEISPNAQRFASENGIAVVQVEGLAQLLRGMPLPPG